MPPKPGGSAAQTSYDDPVKIFLWLPRREGYNASRTSRNKAMPSVENTPIVVEQSTTPQAGDQKIDYSRALRAIGQDLAELFPRILVIEVDGTNFTACGKSHPNPFHRVRKSTFQNIWQRLLGDAPEPDPVSYECGTDDFQRTYTPADIERLDQLFSAKRTGQVTRPDSYSLGERLRALGGIVNSRGGRLQRLRKNADTLFADYWDQAGELRTARLTTVILYRSQEPSRGTAPKELWEGYDF
jgi:hypothetical protein